jgi:hypothetical protein
MPVVRRMKSQATHIVNESFKVETEDNEDHTFSGVMFTVKCMDALPLKYIVVDSVWVRGGLGPLTVWSMPGDHFAPGENCHKRKDLWTQVYDDSHDASETLVELRLTEKVRIQRGEKHSFYVHSRARTTRGLCTTTASAAASGVPTSASRYSRDERISPTSPFSTRTHGDIGRHRGGGGIIENSSAGSDMVYATCVGRKPTMYISPPIFAPRLHLWRSSVETNRRASAPFPER